MASSPNGGVVYVAGGTPQVGGQGHRDIEYLEPLLPQDCDCSLCGPYDHLKWELGKNQMEQGRTFSAMTAVNNERLVMVSLLMQSLSIF